MWTLTGSYACVPVSWLGLVTWPMYRKEPERQMWFSCICSLYGGHVHACAHGGQRSAILLLFSTLLFEIGLSVNLELTNLRISRPAHLRGPRAHFSSGRHCRCVVPHPASSIAAVEPSSGTSVCVADTSPAEPFPMRHLWLQRRLVATQVVDR